MSEARVLVELAGGAALPRLDATLARLAAHARLGVHLAMAPHAPPVALANAGREALRRADAREEVPRAIAEGFRTEDRDHARRIGPPNEGVDGLQRAVRRHLAALRPDLPGNEERRRIAEIRTVALNLESAGDVLARVAAGPLRRSSPPSARTAAHA